MQEFAAVSDFRTVGRIVKVAFGANLEISSQMLKPNCDIATWSSDSDRRPTLPVGPLLLLDAKILFTFVYKMTEQAHQKAIHATTIWLQEGWLKVNLAGKFSLDEIVSAHEL